MDALRCHRRSLSLGLSQQEYGSSVNPRSLSLQRRPSPRDRPQVRKQHIPFAGAPQETSISRAQIDDLLTKTARLIRFSENLDPFEARSFNRATLIWDCLSEIPSESMLGLLDMLSARDIIKLWRIAGERYIAEKQGRFALANYPIADDFPTQAGEVASFDGKAALRLPLLGLDRFKKCFFVDLASRELHGHLVVNKGPLGELLYPVYFRASCDLTTIPATGELADIALEYLPVSKLELWGDQLPVSSWRTPEDPRFPFGGGLVDYLRLVAPGVYVGVGWKAPKKKRELGRRFLYFVIVKNNKSSTQ